MEAGELEMGMNRGVAMMDPEFGTRRIILNYFGLLVQFQGKTGDSLEQDYMALPRGLREGRRALWKHLWPHGDAWQMVTLLYCPILFNIYAAVVPRGLNQVKTLLC